MTTLQNPVTGEAGESNSIKFPAVGTGILVGLVGFDGYQQTDYDTDELKTWKDGSPMMGTKITGVAWESTGAEIGPKDDRTAPVKGSVVTIFVEGSKFYAWRDASAEAAKANHVYEVGDLIWFGCTGTTPATNPKHDDRKDYGAKIGKPTAEHAELVAQCQAAYQTASAIPVAAPANTAPF